MAAKKAKKTEKPKPIEKKYFTVKIETTLPATLTYNVLAETPEQALELTKNLQPNVVKHRLIGRRDTKVSVSDLGSCIIHFVKMLSGR